MEKIGKDKSALNIQSKLLKTLLQMKNSREKRQKRKKVLKKFKTQKRRKSKAKEMKEQKNSSFPIKFKKKGPKRHKLKEKRVLKMLLWIDLEAQSNCHRSIKAKILEIVKILNHLGIFDKQSSATLQTSIHVYSMPKGNRFGSGAKYAGEPSYYVDTCFKPNSGRGVGFGFGNKQQFPEWQVKNMK